MGFVVGNPLLVKAYGDVKDNTDSGQFLAIQKACAASLDHPEITHKIAAKYSRRMDLLVTLLHKFGFNAAKPKGSFFLYVRAPKAVVTEAGQRTEFKSGEDVSQWLITEKLISTVPWDDAGPYLRFSVTFIAKGESDERRVVGEIEKRFAGPEIRVLTPWPTNPVNDVTVNSYVCQLQRRHEQFQREQRVGADAFGQFIHDTFFMRDKNSFDALLRAMLTPPERDRLQTDPTFTQAWQIFVDFCWLQKRFRQFGIIARRDSALSGHHRVWSVGVPTPDPQQPALKRLVAGNSPDSTSRL